jgi:hypothetical protein
MLTLLTEIIVFSESIVARQMPANIFSYSSRGPLLRAMQDADDIDGIVANAINCQIWQSREWQFSSPLFTACSSAERKLLKSRDSLMDSDSYPASSLLPTVFLNVIADAS